MKNIYLIGFMGTGKTVVGEILAKKMDKEFIEMDAVIEDKQGLEIVDIFSQQGEDYFRSLEKVLLGELSEREDLVVSCGGGLVCDQENLKLLKETGVVFALTASVSTIYQRTKKYSHRPILNVDNPQEKIKQLITKRASCYAQAQYSIDTDNLFPEEVVDKILATLSNG